VRNGPLSEPETASIDLDALTQRLARAGFVAAEDEALELVDASGGDSHVLEGLLERRLSGEPLAWVTGYAKFCGQRVRVDPGVYVPRWQSENLARRAVERLPVQGVGLDLCTGSGAIAATLKYERPRARVVASDLDERAVKCARSNGVEAYCGDLFAPVPPELLGRLDVVVGVVPYVPTPSLHLLARDTLTFESRLSYDGGEEGTDILRRAIEDSARFLRPGGALLLELGGDQAEGLEDFIRAQGFSRPAVFVDEDGDTRGIETTLAHPAR
jgi:release factor glutamine methyltransferase